MPEAPPLEFENLPLVEVAVRATMRQQLPITFRAIFTMREALQDAFREVREIEQFEAPPGIQSEVEVRPGVIHGFVLTGSNEGLVLVVQNQVMVCRWVLGQNASGPEYPRYQRLSELLWRSWDAWHRVVGVEPGQPTVVNMSYTNFIEPTPPARIVDYFAPSLLPAMMATAGAVHKLELAWQTDGIDRRIRLDRATIHRVPEMVDGYRLLTVAGLSTTEPDPRNSLAVAHDELRSSFTSILAERALEEWGYVAK